LAAPPFLASFNSRRLSAAYAFIRSKIAVVKSEKTRTPEE
jgi:hypothetical protein